MTDLKKHSKFLSYVLRHHPDAIGIELDANGWVAVDELIKKANASGKRFNRALLDRIVAENDKKRFAFNEDQTLIRASQGHSVEVELSYAPIEPPETLFHGTVAKFMQSIMEQGLIKGSRHHVHLSADLETASKVGQRRGKPVILTVRSGDMHKAGHAFYKSENGVWLTETVPPIYL